MPEHGKMFLRDCAVCGVPILLQWLGGDYFMLICKCGVTYSKLVPCNKPAGDAE